MLHGTKFRFPVKVDDKYVNKRFHSYCQFLKNHLFLNRLFVSNDPNVTVVAVIGKSNLINQMPSKLTCINDYFQHPILKNEPNDQEVYYISELV